MRQAKPYGGASDAWKKPVLSLAAGVFIALLSFLVSNFLQGSRYQLDYSSDFVRLSCDPFAPGNQLHYRILIPLVGYLTGLKGGYYHILSLAGTVLFLAAVHYWASGFYSSKKTAFLLALTLAFLPVVLFNNTIAGWSDIYAYLFLMLALLRPGTCFFFIFLGLLTHEFFAAYIPLIYLAHGRFTPDFFAGRKKILKHAASLAVVFVVYGVIRLMISAYHDSPWTLTYYAGLLPGRGVFGELRGQPLLLGLCSAYEASLALLVLFLMYLGRRTRKNPLDVWVLLSALAPALLLLVAHDTTRFWSATFIFILLFPKYIKENRDRLLVLIAAGNFIVPSFFLGADWWAALDRQAAILTQHVGRDDFFNAVRRL